MDTASHSLVLLQQLNMQREFGFLCDCTVAIGDVYFKAHRAVLAAFSNYFKMIFIHQTSECIKIQPTDIQPDIFSYLLHIMYTGKGPKQIVDHSRLEEGIRFLHADYLSHIATEMNQVFSPETVQSSNLYGIQISTTQKTAVKPGLEVKEAPSNNSGNRAAVQGDHPQLQLSLAIGLDDGTADQQRAHPASQALEEHQKPPVSIKQERCDPESVISQSRPSPSSEVTGPTFTESGKEKSAVPSVVISFSERANCWSTCTHTKQCLPNVVFLVLRLSAGDLAQVDLQKSIWGRRKTERENALPVSTSMFLLLLLLSRFSRVRLCATPPGSPVPGILQARTGVGCQCLLQCIKVKSESEVAQSCRTLSDPMDCSPPGSSTHGIFQAGKNTGVECHCLPSQLSGGWRTGAVFLTTPVLIRGRVLALSTLLPDWRVDSA
ncbi:zinc finger and BTB domain-containing protein 25 isoform X10 [Ovis aries]|uniref:zinc finger and BTB domain-containing protein 25 isoform X10 n=1 Tax=Ovis aries TaxID=9940 RepID=UPI0029528EBF|nr:zinc finger and BTB domain-containing protein 25 isoform X10 [Ovis aries]